MNLILAPEWKRNRKLISPWFNQSAVNCFLPTFNKRLRTLVHTIAAHVDKDTFDIRIEVNKATIDMILETTLGHSIHADEKELYTIRLQECV